MISEKALKRIAQELGINSDDLDSVLVEYDSMINLENLFNWHYGQGDPIYALSSSWNAGKAVPASIVERAISELESVYNSLKDGEDKEELADLLGTISYVLDCAKKGVEPV